MSTCDLCNEPVVQGQGQFGGRGNGDRAGPPPGKLRHWDCHVARYGRPMSAADVLASRPRSSRPVRPARCVLTPRVLKGPDNRSDNARRDWRALGPAISEMGRRRIEIECPFCFETFWAFVWSLAGGGKRCPNCRAMHTSYGFAYPLEGNEDLESAGTASN